MNLIQMWSMKVIYIIKTFWIKIFNMAWNHDWLINWLVDWSDHENASNSIHLNHEVDSNTIDRICSCPLEKQSILETRIGESHHPV
jgi:hypothetical protein